jgi:hypothetical protein
LPWPIDAEALRRKLSDGQDAGSVVIFNKPSNQSSFCALDRNGWADEAAKSAVRSRDKENVSRVTTVQRSWQAGRRHFHAANPELRTSGLC